MDHALGAKYVLLIRSDKEAVLVRCADKRASIGQAAHFCTLEVGSVLVVGMLRKGSLNAGSESELCKVPDIHVFEKAHVDHMVSVSAATCFGSWAAGQLYANGNVPSIAAAVEFLRLLRKFVNGPFNLQKVPAIFNYGRGEYTAHCVLSNRAFLKARADFEDGCLGRYGARAFYFCKLLSGSDVEHLERHTLCTAYLKFSDVCISHKSADPWVHSALRLTAQYMRQAAANLAS